MEFGVQGMLAGLNGQGEVLPQLQAVGEAAVFLEELIGQHPHGHGVNGLRGEGDSHIAAERVQEGPERGRGLSRTRGGLQDDGVALVEQHIQHPFLVGIGGTLVSRGHAQPPKSRSKVSSGEGGPSWAVGPTLQP